MFELNKHTKTKKTEEEQQQEEASLANDTPRLQ